MRRRLNSAAIVSVAAVVTAEDGVVGSARIALGGAGARPVRATAAEDALIGKPLDRATVEAAGAAALADADTFDDAYASAWYRARVLPVHFRRALIGECRGDHSQRHDGSEMRSRVVELVVNGRHREFLVQSRHVAADGAARVARADGRQARLRRRQLRRLHRTARRQGRPPCLVPVETIEGSAVRTLEGVAIARTARSPSVQAAFIDGFATQCGFCTPGMIMAAEALLAENPDPSRDDVVRAISGSLCRCTGYTPIIDAVLDAAAPPARRRPRRPRRRRAERTSQMPRRPDRHELLRERARRRPPRRRHRPSRGSTRSGTSPAARSSSRTSGSRDLLHLKMHRSERHHALLKNVDVSGALAGAGRRARAHAQGRSGELVHGPAPDRRRAQRPAGAARGSRALEGRADLRGHRRDGGRRTRRARRAVRVEYEDLPAVFDIEEALAEDAPIIKPHGKNYFDLRGPPVPAHPLRRRRGAASREADHVFEWTLPVLADRARHRRDDRLHRRAAAERPPADPHRHAGVLLHARQHGPDPRRRRSTSSRWSAAPSAAASAARST